MDDQTILRLTTITMEDRDFATAFRHLDAEIKSRIERDHNLHRMFFSTMTFHDLVQAQKWFAQEFNMRLADSDSPPHSNPRTQTADRHSRRRHTLKSANKKESQKGKKDNP